MRNFILLLGVLFSFSVDAQLSDGDPAPPFTVTDINGNTFSLTDYTSSGKGVAIDFFATWCGPCWSFHHSGVLEKVFTDLSHVAGVVGLEADTRTNTACLYGSAGCSHSTIGNWVTGTPYQMVNLGPGNGSGVARSYALRAYPTLYVISPDNRVYNIRSRTYGEYYSWLAESFQLKGTGIVQNEYCGGDGSITLNTTGGHGSLRYTWSNGETTKNLMNADAGTYTVLVEDGNGYDQTFGPFTIAGPPAPLSSTLLVRQDVGCYGDNTGYLQITGIGGTPGYQYQWSNGMTGSSIFNLREGAYEVFITDLKGCTTTEYYYISEPTELSNDLIAENENCGNEDGIIFASGQGGTTPYTYSIGADINQTGVFNDYAAGEYPVQIKDANGCVYIETVEIEENLSPYTAAEVEDDITCINSQGLIVLDDSIKITAGVDILWYAADSGAITGRDDTSFITVDEDGAYFLTLTNRFNGCADTVEVQVITDTEKPVVEALATDNLDCANQETIIVATAPDDASILWTTMDGNIVSGAQEKEVIVDLGGTYTIEVTLDRNGCVSTEDEIVIQDIATPTADAGMEVLLDCDNPSKTLDGTNSSSGTNFEYLWTTTNGNIISGETTLSPVVDQKGEYNLEVTNTENHCTASAKVIVVADATLPTAQTAEEDDINCDRAPIVLDGTGSEVGADIEYLWTTTDGNIVSGETTLTPTVDQEGTYTLSVSNSENGCKSQSSTKVTLNFMEVTPAFDHSTKNLDYDFTDLSSGAPISWEWDFGDGNKSSDQNPSHKYSTEGTFQVCLMANNGCEAKEVCIDVDVENSTSTNEIPQWLGKVILYPNPTSGKSTIILPQVDADNLSFEILDLKGGLIQAQQEITNQNLIEINPDNVVNGVYFIRLQSEKGSYHLKWIKN